MVSTRVLSRGDADRHPDAPGRLNFRRINEDANHQNTEFLWADSPRVSLGSWRRFYRLGIIQLAWYRWLFRSTSDRRGWPHSVEEPTCSQASSFRGEGQERDLSVHVWRTKPHGHI